MPGSALFVTLEGIEGCGKSTQIERLAAWLQAAGVVCRVTREPGGTAAGEEIRRVLLTPRKPPLTPLSDLLLYSAARAQHLAEIIEPALARGETVLCDRYQDATAVYQGIAGGLPPEVVSAVHDLPGLRRRPDVTLLLDLPAEVGLARARARQAGDGDSLTRFEEADLAFHQRVREGYLQLARSEPGRFEVVTATGSPDDTFLRLRDLLAPRLGVEAAG